ncbi:hypothetical protein HYDPIDRAFT_25211 [Hydnomerulius pinastri MD-312]|nr:hypothetical protein HYDPIDRAFT_25211 [Hydnomerulius pinastri MD-312]
MIADSTLALITGFDKSPASVKLTTQPCSHAHPHADSHAESSYARIQRLAWFLGAHFGEAELHMPEESGQAEQEHGHGEDENHDPALIVMGAVDINHTAEHELMLEWDSSASNDMITDSTLGLITGIDKSPASVKLTTQPRSYAHPHADSRAESSYARIQRPAWFLEAHFGEVELHMPEESGQAEQEHEHGEDENHDPALIVRVDEADAHINLVSLVVTSTNESLKKLIETVLDMAVSTVSSLIESFQSGASMLYEDTGVENEISVEGKSSQSPEEDPVDGPEVEETRAQSKSKEPHAG